jgi:hypothetical protein
MAIQGFQATQKSNSDFSSEVLEEGLYTVEIEKVEAKEGTKYMSTETQMQLVFYLRVIENPDKLLFYNTTFSFFNGQSTGQKKLNPSKLYNLIKTIYKAYKPDVDVSKIKPEELTDDSINELEGKQFKALVKINENGKNKIDSILPIDKVPEKTEKDEIDKALEDQDLPWEDSK